MQPVRMEADDGTEIDGYEFVSGDPGVKTNCHGCTFGDGEVWIEPDQVDDILEGDDYTKRKPECPDDRPEPGDVIIYRNRMTGQADHSARVTKVDENGKVTEVEGLGGAQTETSKLPPGPGRGTAWPYPADTEIWAPPITGDADGVPFGEK
jgi:hypothetical protein